MGESEPPRDSASEPEQTSASRPRLGRLRRFGRGLAGTLGRLSSSLTRRIVVLNLVGLVALLIGFLTLNQFRQGLIEARISSLLIQGEIIAAAISASATVETDTIVMDPDRLLQLQAGEGTNAGEEPPSPLEFSINPERVAPLLRRLVTPTGTRARIYDHDGSLNLDTRTLYNRGDLARQPPAPIKKNEPSFTERAWTAVMRFFAGERPGFEESGPADARNLLEVQRALAGRTASSVRVNAQGETIVSVAVPIQRGRTVRGALLLSTQGGAIDAIIASERFALLQVFLVAALVMFVLSALFAGTIAGPVGRLADAAERVRRGIRARQEIPDFSSRSDEIGHLSGALRDMTVALYNRIDAIEAFAADVAHELKNPLTSLRSAVETLPVAKSENARERLMSIIQHDVRRLDRLISDISDASRLEAEMTRAEVEPVDLPRLLDTLATVANERRRAHEPEVRIVIDPGRAKGAVMVRGHDSRLAQVFTNLLDNARSFSPPDTIVTVSLKLVRDVVEVWVEDEGPGIPPHALERVFERFYTDRPHHGFGQNSGLGLSISRQILEAHGGTIRAENRGSDLAPEGARFVVRLPYRPVT
ncbi:MAG: sensor histidine kinase [Methylobacteriaceae bacterium]|nr:sensor histidine kinase [Methylobacteriaceae bacterium]